MLYQKLRNQPSNEQMNQRKTDSAHNGGKLHTPYITPLHLKDNSLATPQKGVNHLLSRLYDKNDLATHTITGRLHDTTKGRIPIHELRDIIIGTIQELFPDVTDNMIKQFIREKMNNYATRNSLYMMKERTIQDNTSVQNQLPVEQLPDQEIQDELLLGQQMHTIEPIPEQ